MPVSIVSNKIAVTILKQLLNKLLLSVKVNNTQGLN